MSTSGEDRSGYTMIPNAILLEPTISGDELKVWAFMRHRQGENKSMYWTVPQLVEALGMSRKRVMSMTKALKNKKLLTIRKTAGLVNHYIVPRDVLTGPKTDTSPDFDTSPIIDTSPETDSGRRPKTDTTTSPKIDTLKRTREREQSNEPFHSDFFD